MNKLKNLLRILFILGFTSGAEKGFSQLPDHSFQPNADAANPYGLTDLDHFAVRNYADCRWGTIQDSAFAGFVALNFTKLTAGPFSLNNKDLFLSQNSAAGIPIPFPPNTTWVPQNGSFQAGYLYFNQSTAFDVTLFRKFHFNPILFTTEADGRELRLRASTKKLIVLIHGWNPSSSFNSYTDEFANLDSQLRTQLSAAPDWKLVKYHWEPDADTGGAIDFSAVVHGTRAAEIAHQHGQHLEPV